MGHEFGDNRIIDLLCDDQPLLLACCDSRRPHSSFGVRHEDANDDRSPPGIFDSVSMEDSEALHVRPSGTRDRGINQQGEESSTHCEMTDSLEQKLGTL